jgi:hypothetical protein
VVVTFTLLFGAAVAITVFTSAEILLSVATGSALAGGLIGGLAAVAVSGAAGAGAAGAGAAGASLAGAAGGFAGGLALLLATLLELSELSEEPSLARLRAARRSAAVFFFDGLAWSEEDVAVSFCATLGAGAVAAGEAASAAALAAAASSTGAEAVAVGADALASGGGGAATGATGAAGVVLATCIACSLRAMYMYNPPPNSAARAIPTTILPTGEGEDAEFIISTRSLQVTLMFYIRRFVTPVSALELCASLSPTSAASPMPIQLISQ